MLVRRKCNINTVKIRKAGREDLPRVTAIYDTARKFMRKNGNNSQWGRGDAPEDLIENDINVGRLYVIENESGVHGVFMFAIGEDSCYLEIENGKWFDDSTYGVIHRVASDGEIRGVLAMAVKFAKEQISHLRMDTHQDNKVMQRALEKNGFIKCGIIHVSDKTERIAYELCERK